MNEKKQPISRKIPNFIFERNRNSGCIRYLSTSKGNEVRLTVNKGIVGENSRGRNLNVVISDSATDEDLATNQTSASVLFGDVARLVTIQSSGMTLSPHTCRWLFTHKGVASSQSCRVRSSNCLLWGWKFELAKPNAILTTNANARNCIHACSRYVSVCMSPQRM